MSHLHIRVIPRYTGDHVQPGNLRRRASLEELEGAAARLREALAQEES